MATVTSKTAATAAAVTAIAVPLVQVQFESAVENNAQRMMVNYRTLLKKFAALSHQDAFGRHEKLQIEVCSESIVHHAEQLLDMIQELRVRALMLEEQQVAAP